MYRERSNLTLKREQSMLSEMGGQMDPGINVAVPDAGAEDGSYESLMADADGKYAAGDYEGALLMYSMALGSYPDKTEILDGLTKAQTALEEKLANPERQATSGNLRMSEGVASTPGAQVKIGATPIASVHAAQPYEDPRRQSLTPAAAGPPTALHTPMIAPTPAFLEPSSRASSMSLPPQSAMGAATPGPTAPSPALVAAMSGAPSRAASQAGPQSRAASQAANQSWAAPPPGALFRGASQAGNQSRAGSQARGRLSTRPPSASRTLTARPVTPAGPSDIRDPTQYIVSQLSKINEDISQELWERCQDRCEQLIEMIQKVTKDKMDTEKKETYLATVYNHLGKADFAMGNMDKALEDHNLAIHIAETYGLFDVKTVADAAIGRIQMSLGRESSTMWEETIKIDKEIAPKPVAPPPVPGNLTRTKTILATEDSPAMVDIAMPAIVRTHDESADLESMLAEAKAKTMRGDHEGALMLYSAAQTQHPDSGEVEQGLKAAEAALQKSMEGVMTSRADKKVHFNKGWAADDIEDAAVYLDPEQEVISLRKYATQMHEQIEEDLQEGDLEGAQSACEEFLVKFNTLEDDVTLAERFGFLASVHNQLGRALGAQGEMERALDEHTAALQIAERNGLDDVKFEALDLIARLYLSQGNVEKAISTWKECLPVCLNQSEKSEIYHKIALAELTQDNYPQARINGDKSAMAAVKAGDIKLQFNAHLVIGMTLVKSGDRVGALEEYQKALALAVQREDVDQQEDVQRRIDALDSGDLDEAASPPLEAIVAVMVVASPTSSRESSRATSQNVSRDVSRHVTPSASRNQSQHTTPAHSRRSSRAPSPTRVSISYEDEVLSPRGIELDNIKSPRPKMAGGAAVLDDTLLMLQMYLLYTLPEF